MKHMKLRHQAMTLCSDLVTGHLGRLITAIFVCVAVIVANGCKTQKAVEGSIVTGKEFSQSDFQKLRWLEGAWRGSDGGKGAFYEGYRFMNDTTIEVEFFTDSTLSKINGKGMVRLSDKSIINGAGSTFWAATSVDDRSIHFAPKQNVSNYFSWERESNDVWLARLKNVDSQGRQIETVYRMERYKPQ
jgi:hypothetical protein